MSTLSNIRPDIPGSRDRDNVLRILKKESWFNICLAGAILLIIGMIFIVPIFITNVEAQDTEEEYFSRLRERMVKIQISDPPDYRDPVRDKRVLNAMRAVPRHLFVLPQDISSAYRDHPIPIGYGQTISQPYIVALMTEMLDVKPEHKLLEVGTGSGYQAAILSRLVKEVYSVEIIRALGEQAALRLKRLKYWNVHTKVDDGYYGWKENAPFDRIIVTCAATLVPPPLLKQLRPGGKICIPVGGQYTVQFLTMIDKSKTGTISMRKMLPVRFVPLTRTIK